MSRPQALVFDLFGTLFQLEPLGPKLQAAGLPEGSLKLWFARVLRDAFAIECAGGYRDFRDVARGSLEVLLAENGREAAATAIDAVLDAFPGLPAYADVKPALSLARERGLTVATLGNGSSQTARALLEHNGLSALVQQVSSIEEVRHWKPHPAPYLHAVKKLGRQPGEVTLIAAHAWDVQGAKRAGLGGLWVSRMEKLRQPAMEAGDGAAATVLEAVQRAVS